MPGERGIFLAQLLDFHDGADGGGKLAPVDGLHEAVGSPRAFMQATAVSNSAFPGDDHHRDMREPRAVGGGLPAPKRPGMVRSRRTTAGDSASIRWRVFELSRSVTTFTPACLSRGFFELLKGVGAFQILLYFA